MNPEEKEMLKRAIELSEENNKLLVELRNKVRMAMIWGVVKILVIVVPLIISYFYLQPYFGSVGQSLTEFKQLLNQ